MQLRRLTIENYKALGHVDIAFDGKLLFLIGVNGAGKSSILQALSLVHYFAAGRTDMFFKERAWHPTDARPRTSAGAALRAPLGDSARKLPGRNLAITLALEHEGCELLWSFRWSYSTSRTLEETIWLLAPGDSTPRKILGFPATARDAGPLGALLSLGRLNLPGSVLALIAPENIGLTADDADLLRHLQAWAGEITSLELLNPLTMRNRLRLEGDDIGAHGERLASFLAALSSDAKDRVVHRMANFYPIKDLDTTRKRAGWIDMRVAESFSQMGRIAVDHMSDGFLRILALCAIPEFAYDGGLVLVDEVEDGIEPHILPHLIERIAAESAAQLVFTSHSPLLINFFDQDQVYVLARDETGHTVGAPATALAPFQEAEGYLGSGEIWVNTAGPALYQALPRYRAPRRPISDGPAPEDVLRYLRG